MTKRVCAEVGCGEIVDKRDVRCVAHRQEREQARGSRHERGYGSGHVAERARWAPLVATGHVRCWRCGEYLERGSPWDLGHKDDRSGYEGPECWPCSRATAGRR